MAMNTMKIKPEESLHIENIVASTQVADYLDLRVLSSKIKDADYDWKRFPGVVLRMQNPKITALIFSSGKVVLTGAKSTGALSQGLMVLSDKLRSLGFDIFKKPAYSVQNIVTTGDLGNAINLNEAAIGLNLEKIEYEPELFPGLIYRLENPKVVILLYSSGKLIIIGCKTPDDAKAALQKIIFQLHDIGLM